MLELFQKIKLKLYKAFFILLYSWSFKRFGKRSTILFPFRVNGAKYVEIGDKVHINEGSWMLALKLSEIDPILKIRSGTYIGRFSHIVSVENIDIGNNVLISDNVYISDNLHHYTDVKIPIKDQGIEVTKEVRIGSNSWIGENVCVIGSSIGKHCIIGANAVVTSDIPDFTVAVGSPAKVIKKYNHKLSKWEKTN